ncbi:MAG: hypothetical protein JWN46_2243 [Acidimicrobiales bacterium]|nr:hypothetical protein [Acidimicrobiales bacterium]
MSEAATDDEVLAAYPNTRIDQDNVEHYRGRLERRLLVNRCAECRLWHQPPRAVCPRCWSSDVRATEVSGRGTVALHTVLHLAAPSAGVAGGGGYPLAAVDLVEQDGLRFTAPIVDMPEPRIGDDVELTWITRDGSPVPAFRPAGAA